MRNLFILLLPSLFFFACSNEKNPESISVSPGVSSYSWSGTTAMASGNSAENGAGSAPVPIERKLIKEGDIQFETESISETSQQISAAVKKYNGYVSSETENKFPDRIGIYLVVRVPAAHFDNFLADATKGIDHFERKSINVKDVTEEFLDIAARLKTKKELEARYLELLKQAKNVTEILEIERQIATLRADIESFEGRLKYLESQIALSSLTMNFYETIPNTTAYGNKFEGGFRNGWENLIWFFVFLVNLWPFMLLAVVVIVGVRFYNRRKRN